MEFDDTGYYEPSQAEIIVDEFMGKMRKALTDTAKNEIEQLKSENARLEKENKFLRELSKNVNAKARELEEREKSLEREFYWKKFSGVIEPFMKNITAFYASDEGHEQEKCPYCNDERDLVYTANNGKTTTRPCECSGRKYLYEPKICDLRELSFCKNDCWEDRGLIVTAKYEKDRDSCRDDRFFKAEMRMVIDVFSPEIVDVLKKKSWDYKVVFTSKDECQKYCDWLNAEREKLEQEVY